MTNMVINSTSGTFKPGLNLAWRFALRELRGGMKGFYIFLACIALGVGAIAAVNSVARSITYGISNEGQALLGGDISFSVLQRDLPQNELNFLKNAGEISRSTRTRAMARLPDGSDQGLIELKAIDEAYPHYGDFNGPDGRLKHNELGLNNAYVDQSLIDRLNIKIGDTIDIGQASFIISQTIASEPDRLGEGMAFGAKVIISHEAMALTQLIKPGSLIRYTYQLKDPSLSPAGLASLIEEAQTRFPDTGWRIRSRENAAPSLARNIQRFSQFLTLVGLTALIVGGVGIANAIRAFLETKRPVIATFKSLGAPGGFVFLIYLIQIMLLALLGVVIGLVLGALAPLAAGQALVGLVPISREVLFFPTALGLGAAFGLLTALAFTILPLANSNEIPAAALFRSTGFTLNSLPKPKYLAIIIIAILALVSLAIFSSEKRDIALVFTGAMLFAFVLLQAVSYAIQYLARKAPAIRSVEWRMAIANIHRPGALTPSVVMSLGLGLALLVALTQIDANLRRQINGSLLESAPDFFFVDVQSNEVDAFKQKLQSIVPESKVFSVPMLRGRIIELKGIRAEDYEAGEGAWVLRGDRGITYSKNLPENSTLSKGKWWPEDYQGEPLVSFTAEQAEFLNLDVGDILSVNVLGRTIKAKIASLRNVEWESMGINFVLVFSPNTFAGAPHSYLSTLSISEKSQAVSDGQIIREITKSFPSVTSVRVRDVLNTVNTIIGQLSTAIRVAASVTLIASVLVLAGALAAGNRARVHDSVVLKTLGATRWTLIRTFIYEYALLGLSTACFALLAGGIASWFVVSKIMQFPSSFIPSIAIVTLLIALIFTVGFGLVGTWRILGQKASPILREL
jgi:putative ABC transport system permease protein